MVTIAELLKRAVDLEPVSPTPRLDVELLLGSALGRDRGYLFTWPDRIVAAGQAEAFEAMVRRRQTGEPVAYILGQKAFWTLDLAVSRATLIPRPETEMLVEVALNLSLPDRARVLDLGTGTGAIALALASERPDWQILAVDRVQAAVQLAEQNRLALALSNVDILCSDWFDRVKGSFDLILGNPPYIDVDDRHLHQGDVRFEPLSALVSGSDGLADISRIIREASSYLVPGGWLQLEHGAQQGKAVRRSMTAAGYLECFTRCDLAGLERVTGGHLPPVVIDADLPEKIPD